MRRTLLIPVAMATISWASLIAQQGGTPVPPSSPAAAPAPASAADSPSVDLKPVKTELQGNLDSKSAKAGDQIVAKTTESVKTADGTEIPKGSKLIGHVMQVRPHSETSANSAIAVAFDQAELKGGQTLPIHSMIQAVDPPGGAQPGATAPMAGPTAPSAGGSRASTGTGSTAPSSTPVPATSGSADQSQSNGAGAGRVVAGSGPNAIRTTDIPNIYLASNAAGPASGVLYSAKTDVRLDGGTQMVMGIAPAGSH